MEGTMKRILNKTKQRMHCSRGLDENNKDISPELLEKSRRFAEIET